MEHINKKEKDEAHKVESQELATIDELSLDKRLRESRAGIRNGIIAMFISVLLIIGLVYLESRFLDQSFYTLVIIPMTFMYLGSVMIWSSINDLKEVKKKIENCL